MLLGRSIGTGREKGQISCSGHRVVGTSSHQRQLWRIEVYGKYHSFDGQRRCEHAPTRSLGGCRIQNMYSACYALGFSRNEHLEHTGIIYCYALCPTGPNQPVERHQDANHYPSNLASTQACLTSKPRTQKLASQPGQAYPQLCWLHHRPPWPSSGTSPSPQSYPLRASPSKP